MSEAKSPAAGRLASLDVFRGMTIAGMLLVNNAGNWSTVYPPLLHASWHGCTFTDLIFPFFLFIVGVSLVFSQDKRLAAGTPISILIASILKRGVILVLLGMALNLMIFFAAPWVEHYRPPGVLQRIGVCYILASLIALWFRPRGVALWAAGLLLFYWAAMSLIPVPGFGAGVLEQKGNLASYIDSVVFGPHAYIYDEATHWAHDPEGVFSTLPAVATTLLGCLTGRFIRSRPVGSPAVAGWLILAGCIALGLGILWSGVFPLNKNLWTSSYVLVSAGWSGIVLGILYWVIDVKKISAWALGFRVYGLNPITAYVGAGVMSISTIWIKVPGPDGEKIFLKSWIYQNIFEPGIAPFLGAQAASASYGLFYVLLWCLLMFILYKKGIFLRV